MEKRTKKYTYEEVKEIIKELECILIDTEYLNVFAKLTFRDKYGYFYYYNLNNILNKKGFSKFSKSNPYTIQNIKLWLKLNNSDLEFVSGEYASSESKLIFKDEFGYHFALNTVYLQSVEKHSRFHVSNPYTIENIKLWCGLNNKPFELVSETYYSNEVKLKWKCSKLGCGEYFDMNWQSIYSHQNCPFCRGLQVGLSNCLGTRNPELITEWHPTLNGDLTPFDVTYGSKKKVWWQCKECKHEWTAQICDRNKKSSGCPACNESKGEIKIREWLIQNKVDYMAQKTFEGLFGVRNGLLSYDFYLPSNNLLIEFQGEQHEKFCKGIHTTKNDFERQQEHDRRKKVYAQLNGYKFLEIWYRDFDNIEDILAQTLKG